MEDKQQKLYGYLFHFNSFTGLWSCFKREDSVKYFNGDKTIEVFTSDKHSTLVGYIMYENKKEEEE